MAGVQKSSPRSVQLLAVILGRAGKDREEQSRAEQSRAERSRAGWGRAG